MQRSTALLRYGATRLLLAPFMLWMISSIVFLLLRVAPGDPVDAVLGNRATAAAREALRVQLGLDQPLLDQYFEFITRLFQGDLGYGLINEEPVLKVIYESLPASIELAIFSLLIALFLGICIGFTGVAKPNKNIDLVGRVYGIGTYALPPFWAAMMVQLVFGVLLGWFPVGGRFPASLVLPEGTGFLVIDSIINADWEALQGTFRHLILPASTLGLLLSGIFSRALRINLSRSLSSDYVEAARSRGLNERRVIVRHALPNALLPLLTILGITVASLIGGALLVELTFSWPGIALRLQEAINQRDYPVVQGIVVVIAAIVVFITLAVDILVALIDPRVRY